MNLPRPSPKLVTALNIMGLAMEGAVWTQLRGGHSNQIWRITEQNEAVVVKSYPSNWFNPLFVNSANLETEALKAFAPFGFVPQFLGRGHVDERPFIAYRHVLDSKETLCAFRVGGLLRKVHSTDVSGTKLYSNLSPQPDLRKAILTLANGVCDTFKDVLYKTLDQRVPPAQSVILHGDATPSNFVMTNLGLNLLDWQCPCWGDPCFDLALFLSPTMRLAYGFPLATARDKSELMTGYDDAAVASAFENNQAAYHALFAAYSHWQVQQGNAQYRDGFAAEMDALRRTGFN